MTEQNATNSALFPTGLERISRYSTFRARPTERHLCAACGRRGYVESHHRWRDDRSGTTLEPTAQTEKLCAYHHWKEHPEQPLSEYLAREAAAEQRDRLRTKEARLRYARHVHQLVLDLHAQRRGDR